MKLAITGVKDEVDVIEDTIMNMLPQVDVIYVNDNMSSDGTREILENLASKHKDLHIFDDNEVAYYQSYKMSALAAKIYEEQGEPGSWIIPFDADEIWRGLSFLDTLPEVENIVRVRGWDYRPCSLDELGTGHYYTKIGYRESSPISFEPKVAFRYQDGAVIGQGNHHVGLPGHSSAVVIHPEITISHFPIRSFAQFEKKVRNGAAAYAATDMDECMGSHWRRWGAMSDKELRVEYLDNFYITDPVKVGLVYDPITVR